MTQTQIEGRTHANADAPWRSLEELAGAPNFRAFLDSEFPHLPGAWTASSRRQFLKLMGASLALAGASGCIRWPEQRIAPYANRPRNRMPGVPVMYATSMELGGAGTGLLVKSFDGRPIKIEGNPRHPDSLGGTSALHQASVLQLYDPDRSTAPIQHRDGQQRNSNWKEFDRWATSRFAALRHNRGAGLCVLSEASSSLTLADARTRLKQAYPQMQWFEYEPLSRDSLREGTRAAFGAPYRTHLNFDAADLIVSFDDDFLYDHPAALRYTRLFARRRTPRTAGGDGRGMNRLVQIESTYSLTGSNADQRYAEPPGELGLRLVQLASALRQHGVLLPDGLQRALATLGTRHSESGTADTTAPPAPTYIEEIAKGLAAHRGASAITVGYRQPPEMHALAAGLNHALGNVGRGLSYTREPDPDRPTHLAAIRALVDRLAAGDVDTLLILGGNPVYDAPADLDFSERLAAAPHTIHLSLYNDETSRLCEWHVPRAHYLESWGDTRGWDGVLSTVQPLIAPLFGGRTLVELLAQALEEPPDGQALTKRAFLATLAAGKSPEAAESAWRHALHDGIAPDTAWPAEAPPANRVNWEQIVAALCRSGPRPRAAAPSSASATERPSDTGEAPASRPAVTRPDGFDIIFAPDKLHDGRFANNAWLQELPSPLTKLTWDNAALISPADAAAWGVRRDDQIEITFGDQSRDRKGAVPGPDGGPRSALSIRMPVYVLPGQAPGTITLPLGYGRTQGGAVSAGAGFNTYTVRTSGAPWCIPGASARPTGRKYKLATTQDHHAIQSAVGERATRDRAPKLVREGTLAEYKADPKFVQHIGHSLPLIQPFSGYDYAQGNRWGMAIDLSKCTGCSACVTACQAENNVPVVGKPEVIKGREMHWIRVDRYFRGKPNEASGINSVHQPVTCVHCENAPCEQVCPVAATVHDREGLNVMVYNRCIGTRYCSNNCPFKVRRFNWFFNHYGPHHPRNRDGWWQTRPTKVEQMVYNPDVTVRTRGVMEKCMFCVQRIKAAQIEARNENRAIKDLEVRTACQQACPAEAIMFGDLNLEGSQVSRWHGNDRAYEMLEELNIRSRTRYLARLQNPWKRDGGTEAQRHER